LESIAERKHRTEIYLQFDTFDDAGYKTLRGASLLETKLLAIEQLGNVGLNTILVCTVQPGVNDHEIGRLVEFGIERPWITGVSFQPATYSGRYVLPETLENRITFPDVIQAIAKQSTQWLETDFAPLPCAHPNGHTLSYAYRSGNRVTPLARFVDLDKHLDLLSGRITFNRERAKELIENYLSRQACGGGDCGCGDVTFSAAAGSRSLKPGTSSSLLNVINGAGFAMLADLSPEVMSDAVKFFTRAMTEDLNSRDMFRITTTSFMDAYNFDVRQLMKECVHFVLPSGHLIPFSAYNVLYRDGHVPLPPIQRRVPQDILS